jgi:uncharacterized protein YcaQ
VAPGVLDIKGVWAQPEAPAGAGAKIAAGLRGLADWLGADEIRVGKRVPRAWAADVRAGLRG